ncbi:MAG: Gfo/Idh/MocA family oxidoreductase [Puniceicoccales bacterium]|nr:Gfo/Idh/MocA family oxidoreductase [Puniceicoccales bacterium]
MPFLTCDLLANPPSERVRHASFGASGMAWADLSEIAKVPNVEVTAVCDVDKGRWGNAKKRFPKAAFYQDWRELLDKEAKNIDSVNVSTPDHMHAPISVAAMQRGKHVYCQKPLTHDLFETRRMTEIAREKGVVTQMGIQIHSESYYRTAVKILRAGVIGKIKEVHSWDDRRWGDSAPLPNRTDPVPAEFAWDLWLGIAAERPFLRGYYHPGNWRKRLDFGVGTLGDMACHILDPVFGALELGSPISVRSDGPAPNQWSWATSSRVALTFEGTKFTAGDKVLVNWSDGGARPPEEVKALLEGQPLPGSGSIFVGTEGTLVLPHINQARLFPLAKFKGFSHRTYFEKRLNHWGEFVNACRGKGKTEVNFDYAGPLTEAVLFGSVAVRFPKTLLKWDAKALKFDSQEANAFVHREYRKGWEVKGL